MAPREKKPDVAADIVQAHGPAPSVMVPYPGSALPAVVRAEPKPAPPAPVQEEEEDEEEEASEGDGFEAGAFMKPMTPSPELAAIVGAEPITRVAAVQGLWMYIKKNKLQDRNNPRLINGDALLSALFGAAQINMFEMTKVMLRNLR